MCIKENIAYRCGHSSIPVVRPCPITTSFVEAPVCGIQGVYTSESDTNCYACEKVLHKRWILILEYEHRFLHERGACDCDVIYPIEETRPRLAGGGVVGGSGSPDSASLAAAVPQATGEVTDTGPQVRKKDRKGQSPLDYTPTLFKEMVGPDGKKRFAVKIPGLFAVEWRQEHRKMHEEGRCACNAMFKPVSEPLYQGSLTKAEEQLLRRHRELEKSDSGQSKGRTKRTSTKKKGRGKKKDVEQVFDGVPLGSSPEMVCRLAKPVDPTTFSAPIMHPSAYAPTILQSPPSAIFSPQIVGKPPAEQYHLPGPGPFGPFGQNRYYYYNPISPMPDERSAAYGAPFLSSGFLFYREARAAPTLQRSSCGSVTSDVESPGSVGGTGAELVRHTNGTLPVDGAYHVNGASLTNGAGPADVDARTQGADFVAAGTPDVEPKQITATSSVKDCENSTAAEASKNDEIIYAVPISSENSTLRRTSSASQIGVCGLPIGAGPEGDVIHVTPWEHCSLRRLGRRASTEL
ncbi:hypothetical protein VTK73DRAFT_3864 [Phialemonium thermophilum]|uniref:Uncharacterized protein n=1 Tax=Phialemonium thermophilum TaxID=223376 RepID=A0ABR3WXH7_9PEZI